MLTRAVIALVLAVSVALATPVDAPPGTVCVVIGGELEGGVPLYDGSVVWSRGDVSLVGAGTVRRLARPIDPKKPVRAELAPLVVQGPSPLDLAITASMARLRGLYEAGDWEGIFAENARLLELVARRDAGETEP